MSETKVTLTFEQVEKAYSALVAYNPAVQYKTKIRLSRNLGKLESALRHLHRDRNRITLSAVTDKNRKPENERTGILLTAEEQLKIDPEIRQLLQDTIEVSLHPVWLYDSSVGQVPNDPLHCLDISKIPLPSDVLSGLIDVVLIEQDA